MEEIRVSGSSFTDEYGRERIFNGVNFSDKQGYDVCKQTFRPFKNRDVLKKCKECGFNIIRLGFTWAAVEPKPSRYNEALLEDIGDILDKAYENDVYIILDMHQDLYSEQCRHGDGAPPWATLTDGCKFRYPVKVWAEGYFYGKAVHKAFDNFWSNTKVNGKGLQDYYADMWKHLAEKFKDKPALFGYDLMNEPFPGTPGGKIFRKLIKSAVVKTVFDKRLKKTKMLADLVRDKHINGALKHYNGEIFEEIVSVGTPEVRAFDLEKYGPFLNKITESIRSVTDKGIILMDSCYYCNLGIPTFTPPITVNGKVEKNVCYSPHGYDLTVDTPAYAYADNSRVGAIFDEHKNTQEKLNIPLLVGEWGSGARGTRWLSHIKFLLEKFDQNKWSNTYWCFDPQSFSHPVCKILSRPYPKAVTGTIQAYRFDRKKRVFTVEYHQDENFKRPTVIYLPSAPECVILDGKEIKKPKLIALSDSGACDLQIKTETGVHTIEISL